MNAFDVLGDPVRRRILELLADAVSQHLRVLRESGFASVTAQGTRRLYKVETSGFEQVDAWLGRFRGFWETHLDALGKEIQRGKESRKEGKQK
jgi:DNA-binding transcriptional ArsR family regulator